MKKLLSLAKVVIILSFVIIIITIITNLGTTPKTVQNGKVTFQNENPIKLEGKWKFYWHQLVMSNGKLSNVNNYSLVDVPSSWTRYKGANKKFLPTEGYGTYKIALISKPGKYLSLKLPQISSSYNLWINGKLRLKNGQVGMNYNSSKPKWSTNVVTFLTNSNETEVMLEVSNYYYFRSGISSPIILGNESDIQQLKYQGLFIETFIFSSLLVMGLFFLFLFIVNNKNKAYIALALFSIVAAVRPLLYGECYFNNLFPNLSFEISTKVYYENFIAIQLFFLYFYYQYDKIISKKLAYFIGIPVIIIILIGIILPSKFMFYPVTVLETIIPIAVFFTIYILYKAYKNTSENIGVNVLSVLLLSFLTLIDVLSNNKIIEANIYYGPIAIIIITFIQTFIQVCKFRDSDLLSEKLAHEINLKNVKLGYEIKQRETTEKLYNSLKSIVAILSTEELLINIVDNLYKIIKFDSVVLSLNYDNKYTYIVTKSKNSNAKCNKYESVFNNQNNKLETGFIQIQKLYTYNDISKSIIIKQVKYESYVFCILKIIINDEIELIPSDLRLIDIYTEQSMLAVQNSKAYEKIKVLAMYDELTMLYNRRYIYRIGEEQYKESIRSSTNFGVMMLDIDYFKKINDTYGHIFGDEILKTSSSLLQSEIPVNAIIGRYGGEEFLVLVQNTSQDDLLQLAENLRSAIENQQFLYNTSENVRITISIGVSIRQENQTNLQEIISKADRALYSAKASGRNRVCFEI